MATGFAVDAHPQKAKIIDWILAGRSSRDIGTSCVPPIPHTSINRYKTSVIKPMLARAETSARILGMRKGKIIETEALSDVPEAIQDTRKSIMDAPALHIRENRLKIQQELTSRLMRVVNERATDMSVCEACRRPESAHPWEEMVPGVDAAGKPVEVRRACDEYRRVPGGETGLVIRKLKATGIEYAVDTAVLAEIREQEKHAAIELGQWQENAGAGSVSIQIVCPSAGPGELPRVSFAASDQLELPAAEEDGDPVAEIGIVQR